MIRATPSGTPMKNSAMKAQKLRIAVSAVLKSAEASGVAPAHSVWSPSIAHPRVGDWHSSSIALSVSCRWMKRCSTSNTTRSPKLAPGAMEPCDEARAGVATSATATASIIPKRFISISQISERNHCVPFPFSHSQTAKSIE